MIELSTCVVGFAIINWLKGFAIGDNRHPGSPPLKLWERAINFMTSDGWCGIYLAGLAFLMTMQYHALWLPYVCMCVLIAPLYAYGDNLVSHKRILFVCWNANINDLLKYIDKEHERWVAGNLRYPKRAATRYGTYAGLGFSMVFVPIIAFKAYIGEFNWYNALSLLPPLLFGVTYYAMNILPNPNEQGETVGRAIYGAILGGALYLAVI